MNIAKLSMVSAAIFSLAGCGEESLDYRNAQISNGIIFNGQENQPFSGLLTNAPESIFPFSPAFNDFLVVFNRNLEKIKSKDNQLIGQHLACNIEVRNGYVDGLTVCMKSSSTIKRYEAHFKDGNLNGDTTIYAIDGSTILATTHFTDGVINGSSKLYGPHTGKLIGDYNSSMGKSDGEQTAWDEKTGKVIYQAMVKDGQYVGTAKTWSSDGQLTSETPYANGLPNGEVKEWTANTGKIIAITTFLDGVKEGKAKRWDEHGNLISSGSYKQGVWHEDQRTAEKQHTIPSESEECSTKWIEAFHKENGEDSIITNDQLNEWDSWCNEGKSPE